MSMALTHYIVRWYRIGRFTASTDQPLALCIPPRTVCNSAQQSIQTDLCVDLDWNCLPENCPRLCCTILLWRRFAKCLSLQASYEWHARVNCCGSCWGKWWWWQWRQSHCSTQLTPTRCTTVGKHPTPVNHGTALTLEGQYHAKLCLLCLRYTYGSIIVVQSLIQR